MVKVIFDNKDASFIEKILPDFINDGGSEIIGNQTVWQVDLPEAEIALLKNEGFLVEEVEEEEIK